MCYPPDYLSPFQDGTDFIILDLIVFKKSDDCFDKKEYLWCTYEKKNGSGFLSNTGLRLSFD